MGYFAARASGASFSFSGHTYHDLDLMPEKLAAASFVTVVSEFERALRDDTLLPAKERARLLEPFRGLQAARQVSLLR